MQYWRKHFKVNFNVDLTFIGYNHYTDGGKNLNKLVSQNANLWYVLNK